MRNGNFLKLRVSEIRVKRIRVNQGLGVLGKTARNDKKINIRVRLLGSNKHHVVLEIAYCYADSRPVYLTSKVC